MSRIVLATASMEFEERIRHAFNGTLNGDLRRWRDDDLQLVDAHNRVLDLSEDDPELVVLGPDIPVTVALDVAKVFDEQRPEISVILVAEPTPDLWQQALRVGVRDVLSPEAPNHELRRSFDRAIASAQRLRASIGTEDDTSGPAGKVITVVAPKGGAGKTAIASNLAVRLSRSHPGEVVLVDLDLQFGDLTYALGLDPDHTFADAARAPGVLDATTLKVFLTSRNRDLYVLCAPESPAEGEDISEARITRIIRLLAAEFPYVVIDTAAGLNEQTLAALELSSDFVLVTDLSFSAARGMRRVLEALNQLDMTEPQRHLVLNRADSKVAFDPNDVAGMLGMKVNIEIPSTREVPLSMNQGVPLVELNPRSPVSKSIERLAGLFAEVEAKKNGGLLWRRVG